jgi:hypothetical protein
MTNAEKELRRLAWEAEKSVNEGSALSRFISRHVMTPAEERMLAALMKPDTVLALLDRIEALENALASVLYVDCCGPVTALGPRAHHAASNVLHRLGEPES